MIINGNRFIRRYKATTLAEYINRIGLVSAKDPLYFRGLSNNTYKLTPSLCRKGYNSVSMMAESKLVEYAEQQFPNSFVKPTPVLLLANMQHYGIPTRMMDVTGNALVALYFACRNSSVDGNVVVFSGKTVSAYNVFANIISDTYRLTNNAITTLEKYSYLICKQSYASSLLYPNWEADLSKFTIYIKMLQIPIIVDVGAVNQRQINQDGKFILFPNKISKKCILNELVTLDSSSELIQACIDIPKESKARILDQLKLVGITETFLFPDNIESVCNMIKQRILDEQ